MDVESPDPSDSSGCGGYGDTDSSVTGDSEAYGSSCDDTCKGLTGIYESGEATESCEVSP